MQGNAIERVGIEISKLLKPVVGTYLGPLDADDEAVAGAQLVLFPYRVSVNADLRNTEHRVPALLPDPHGGPPTIRDQIYDEALPLDLLFLLCERPVKPPLQWTGAQNLGLAMQTLNGPGGRFGLLVDGELVHLSLDATSSEEMARIWALFPAINYRTAVVYLASPVWIDPVTPRTAGAPVVHEKYQPRHLEAAEAQP